MKNISLHYNVPTAKSSFCQLIDSFEAKWINSLIVPFVYPGQSYMCLCQYLDIKEKDLCWIPNLFFFQQPGELDYAELDDFRPSVQPVAAAAEAAPARPLIRRPAYEGTEYADITQFGVPQPEPTYGNVPKKDVVYSNVQGI